MTTNLIDLKIPHDEAIKDLILKLYSEGVVYQSLGQVLLKINPYPKVPKENELQTNVELMQKYFHNLKGITPHHIYRVAEDLRRFASDNGMQQTLVFRGCSGSGKTEALKQLLQYYIFTESNQDNVFSPPNVDLTKPLGSYLNPFLISSDAPTILKKLYANIVFFEYFTTSIVGNHTNASRCYKYIRLQYNSHGKLSGFRMTPFYLDFLKFSPKDPNANPLLIQYLCIHGLPRTSLESYMLNQSGMKDQYPASILSDCGIVDPMACITYLQTILIEYGGLTVTEYENILKVIGVIIHLQSLMILGTDVSMISSGTKTAIMYAEQLLGLTAGSLGPLILKKPDDRLSGGKLGNGNITNFVETKPYEAKVVIDYLCYELFTRMCTFVCNTLAVNMSPFYTSTISSPNMNVNAQNNIISSSGMSVIPSRQGVIHLLDTIGVERLGLNALPGVPPPTASYTQLMNHYVEEKWYELYLQEVFVKEINRYETAGIVLTDVIPLPDYLPYIEVYEKPLNNVILPLDELCLTMNNTSKVEDKVYIEKLLLLRNKYIKNGGMKMKKPTIFQIKHSFGEVYYDCESFYVLHKSGTVWSNSLIGSNGVLLNPSTGTTGKLGGCSGMYNLLQVSLASSNISFIKNDEYNTLSMAFTTPNTTPNTTNNNTNPMIMNYTFHKNQSLYYKLCQELSLSTVSTDTTPTTPLYGENKLSFVYCMSIVDSNNTNNHNNSASSDISQSLTANTMDWILTQCKLGHLEGLIRLYNTGYGTMISYLEFYTLFRSCLPFIFTSLGGIRTPLPTVLPSTPEHDPVPYCLALLDVLMTTVPLFSMTYPQYIPYSTSSLTGNDLFTLNATLIVFTTQGIFLKTMYYQVLIDYRYALLTEQAQRITQITSCYRGYKVYQAYQHTLLSIIIIQASIRKYLCTNYYQKLLYYGKLMKRKLLVKYYMTKYHRYRKAGLKITTWFVNSIRYQLRYQVLQRATHSFHYLARGFIIRKQCISLYTAVRLIQRVCIQFLRRRQVIKRREKAILTIQRVFRGTVIRRNHGKEMKILYIRKEQRIASGITRKLQSIWRKKLVQTRYQLLLQATITLQAKIRQLLYHKQYCKAKKLIIWLQSHGRRLNAVKKYNLMKVSLMVSTEKNALSTQLIQELTSLTHLTWSQCTLGSYFLSKYHMKRVQQLILSFDFTFDLSIAYPNGWLHSLFHFIKHLYQQTKRRIKSIALGSQHTIIIDDANDVYAMGLGDLGQLGCATRQSYTFPKLIESMGSILALGEHAHSSGNAIPTLPSLANRVVIVDVCCGRDHTLIRTNTGRVYSWGDNRRGQLGHSDYESSAVPRMVIMNEELKPLANVSAIACGAYHSAALADPGVLYTWGAGECLGHIPDIPMEQSQSQSTTTTPVVQALYRLRGGRDTKTVQSSDNHKVLRNEFFLRANKIHQAKYQIHSQSSANNTSFYGSSGSSSSSSTTEESIPIIDSCHADIVPFFHRKHKILTLACGESHIVVQAGNDLFAWGGNAYGQLGIGNTNYQRFPERVLLPYRFSEYEMQHAKLFCGGRHMVFLCKGNIWCWGWNKYGQVGDGSTENILRPIRIIPRQELPTGSTGAGGGGNHASAMSKRRSSMLHARRESIGAMMASSAAAAAGEGGSNKILISTTRGSTSSIAMTKCISRGPKIVSVTIGWRQTVVMTSTYQLFGWGVMNTPHSITLDGVRNLSPPVSILPVQSVDHNPFGFDYDDEVYMMGVIPKHGHAPMTPSTPAKSSFTMMKADDASTSKPTFEPFQIFLSPTVLPFTISQGLYLGNHCQGLHSASCSSLSLMMLDVELNDDTLWLSSTTANQSSQSQSSLMIEHVESYEEEVMQTFKPFSSNSGAATPATPVRQSFSMTTPMKTTRMTSSRSAPNTPSQPFNSSALLSSSSMQQHATNNNNNAMYSTYLHPSPKMWKTIGSQAPADEVLEKFRKLGRLTLYPHSKTVATSAAEKKKKNEVTTAVGKATSAGTTKSVNPSTTNSNGTLAASNSSNSNNNSNGVSANNSGGVTVKKDKKEHILTSKRNSMIIVKTNKPTASTASVTIAAATAITSNANTTTTNATAVTNDNNTSASTTAPPTANITPVVTPTAKSFRASRRSSFKTMRTYTPTAANNNNPNNSSDAAATTATVSVDTPAEECKTNNTSSDDNQKRPQEEQDNDAAVDDDGNKKVTKPPSSLDILGFFSLSHPKFVKPKLQLPMFPPTSPSTSSTTTATTPTHKIMITPMSTNLSRNRRRSKSPRVTGLNRLTTHLLPHNNTITTTATGVGSAYNTPTKSISPLRPIATKDRVIRIITDHVDVEDDHDAYHHVDEVALVHVNEEEASEEKKEEVDVSKHEEDESKGSIILHDFHDEDNDKKNKEEEQDIVNVSSTPITSFITTAIANTNAKTINTNNADMNVMKSPIKQPSTSTRRSIYSRNSFTSPTNNSNHNTPTTTGTGTATIRSSFKQQMQELGVMKQRSQTKSVSPPPGGHPVTPASSTASSASLFHPQHQHHLQQQQHQPRLLFHDITPTAAAGSTGSSSLFASPSAINANGSASVSGLKLSWDDVVLSSPISLHPATTSGVGIGDAFSPSLQRLREEKNLFPPK